MQLLQIPRVASRLDLATLTVTHWAYGHRPAPQGFPAPIRVGRQLRYVESEIDNWIRQQRGEQPAPEPLPQAANPALIHRRRGRPTNAERAARSQGASR